MHKAKTNNNFTKFISMLLVVLMLVSIVPITASADPASASFENVSGEGKDIISLAEGREYKASIPISADVDPATITWTMVKDSSKSYVSKELFPNQTEGGALSTWICDDGKTPFFNEVKTSVSDSNGQKTPAKATPTTALPTMRAALTSIPAATSISPRPTHRATLSALFP